MKILTRSYWVFMVCSVLTVAAHAQIPTIPGRGIAPATTKPARQIAQFVPNKGQLSDQFGHPMPDVLFSTRESKLRCYLTAHSLHFIFSKVIPGPTTDDPIRRMMFAPSHPIHEHDSLMLQRLDMEIVGASPKAQVHGRHQSGSYCNYYLANCALTKVPNYNEVVYENIYPHIDLIVTELESGLKHEFIVHPGGDPSVIKLRYAGMDSMRVSSNGELAVYTPIGALQEDRPFTFQETATEDESGKLVIASAEVRSAFSIDGRTVSFTIGSYDRSKDLVIDPLHPAWGTYFGGGTGEEQAQSPAINRAGNIYFCGFTQTMSGMATTGAFQTVGGGGYDAYLAKFDPSGNEIWSTYYGGSGDEYAGGLALDSTGNVILYGQTGSKSGIATVNSHQDTLGGVTDAFIAKFDSTGVRLWGTYYGGPGPEQINGFRSVAVDHAGRIFITGTTNSSSGIATATAFQSLLTLNGFDAFVAYFTPTGSIGWGTYFGGSGEEFGLTVATDNARNLYVGGATSTNGSFTTSSGFQANYGGGSHDGYIAKFNATAGGMMWCSYIGGTGDEAVIGLTTDTRDSTIYFCGSTGSTSNISTVGSYQSAAGGNIDGFITHITPNCKVVWSTYYGGSNADFADDLMLDSARFFVAGRTSSTNGISVSPTYQASIAGFFDAFLIRMTRAGVPTWSTYYGGAYTDYGYGCAIDKLENPVMTGSTTSPGGIATAGAFQSTGGGGTNRDGYVVKFCDLDQPILTHIRDTICGDGRDTLTLNEKYEHIYWFDTTAHLTWLDDSLSYILSESTLSPGHHAISVEVHNGINCMLVTDTANFTIYPGAVVDAGPDTAICFGENVTLKSVVQGGRPPFKYNWLPTAGLSSGTSASPKATPTKTTIYHLFVTDAGGCTTDDSVTVTVHTLPVVTLPLRDTICPGSSTVIGDSATDGIPPYTYTWSPATNLSAWNVATPTATPGATTKYTVIVTDSVGCQTTASTTVVVSSTITPKISPAGSVSICIGDSVVLHAAKGFATYQWSNGATTDSIVVTQTGSFTVSVTTASGCSGTSQPVVVSISPDPVATITPSGPVSLCSGATATLTANAGAYTYLWSDGETTPSITVSTGGSYSVTIKNAAGCSGTSQPVVVTINPPVHPPISGPSSICVGEGPEAYSIAQNAGSTYDWTPTNGAITTGQGTNSATIQWNDAVTGTATLRVIETTASGCLDTGMLDITITQGLQPTITGGPLSFCDGDSVTLDAGGPYATYQWSKDGSTVTGATGEFLRVGSSGSYSVAVSNASGCTGSSSGTTVTVFPTPPVPVISQTNDSLVSTLAATYQWTRDGAVVAGATKQVFTPAPAGTYVVTITDANGCTSTSAPFTVAPNGPASVTVSVPPKLTAVPGDNVQIPISLSKATNLLESGAKNYVGILRFNSSLLASVGSTPLGVVTNPDRLITFNGSNTVASGVVQTLSFVATLGTDSCTDITIDTFYWTDAAVTVTRENGSFCETGICNAGGQLRLIDPTGVVSLAQSYPNPATGIAHIDFQVIEEGLTHLSISDLFGREILSVMSSPLKAGSYSTTVDVSALASGSYLYSLRTPSSVLTRIMQVTH